jgi:serine O-acetyltransferase
MTPSPEPTGMPAPTGRPTLWAEIRCIAQEVAEREPLLQRRLRHLVLERDSLGDMLAAILARQLACDDLPEARLFATIYDVLREEEAIVSQASADLDAVKTRDPAWHSHVHVLLNLKGFQALQAYRVAHCLWRQGRKELACLLSSLGSFSFGVDIHPAARIGCGVMLDHGIGIVIGETAVVEDQVSILQGVTLGGTGKERGDRHPKVRSGVMIGAGAKVLGNIEIGTMSKIAAGSVVLHDVPPYATVAGVPARVVRQHGGDVSPALEMYQKI